MHLTRPKSSKGRSRPAVNITDMYGGGDTDNNQGIPGSNVCGGRPDRNLRSRSQPVMMWPSGSSQMSRDEVLHLLQHNPAPPPPPQSLNKYKVLPSIERRRSEGSADGRMSQRHLPADPCAFTHGCSSDALGPDPHPPHPPPQPPREQASLLLLAIRTPCGRRFEQHFDPDDTLKAVRTSAETRYRTRYGDVSIETMDVPRRTFTDLDLTLSLCGIMNRSVLCICQNNNDNMVEQD